MRDLKEINILITECKDKIGTKSFKKLAIHLTNYCFYLLNITKKNTDVLLLEKMAIYFLFELMEYILYPYKRKKKLLSKLINHIDKEMYEWKKETFNEWLFANLSVEKEEIKRKKKLLRL